MASFMDSVSKGLTTINVKTSNFMEENKLRTSISTKENEISQLKIMIGNIVYENKEDFTQPVIQEQIKAIDERLAAIENLKKEIEGLAEKEKDILGSQNYMQSQADNTPKIYCAKCGSPNETGYKFCEKCGSPLA